MNNLKMKFILILVVLLMGFIKDSSGQIYCEAFNKRYILEYECKSIQPLTLSRNYLDSLLVDFFNDTIPAEDYFFRIGTLWVIDTCEILNNLSYKRAEYLGNHLRKRHPGFEKVTILIYETAVFDTSDYGKSVAGLLYDFPPIMCQ